MVGGATSGDGAAMTNLNRREKEGGGGRCAAHALPKGRKKSAHRCGRRSQEQEQHQEQGAGAAAGAGAGARAAAAAAEPPAQRRQL